MNQLYRVWDKKKKKWVNNEVLLGDNGEIYRISKDKLRCKIKLLPETRYVCQMSSGVRDKNKILLFEGDIVACKKMNEKEDEKGFIGQVCYLKDQCRWVILDFNNNKWYEISSERSNLIEKTGLCLD